MTDCEQYVYNSYGYLYQVKFNGTIVWQLTGMDSYGRNTQATAGPVTASWTFNSGNNTLSQIAATNMQQFNYSFDVNTGNLNSRANGLKSLSESFGYDSDKLDRLTSVTGPVNQTLSYTTNKNGNILRKSDAGTNYVYDETPYAVSSIENFQNISSTNQTIDYYSFEKVKKITEGAKTAEFEYNADRQRIRMVLKDNGTTTKTRWYFGSSCEREQVGSTVTQYIWIGGDAYTAVAVAKKVGTGSWTVYNIFRDHLGTITHMKTGSAITEYSYDAWGRRRDKDTWSYTLSREPALFADRGFTAHEYLDDFKLYNMNGRMYDPVVGRFLSPDPFVQAPGFSQSFNRYSYCLNNPLKFTDPSGNKWKWKWLNPMHWFSEGMQWVNDNTEGVRSKMADAGIPDFSVGTSINMSGNVNFNGSYRGQEMFNSENVDRSNAVQVVNQAINQTRQTYGQAWMEVSSGGGTTNWGIGGTTGNNGFGAISSGPTLAFSSPFSNKNARFDSGGYGISLGFFHGTLTRGLYFTTMRGEGAMLSLSWDVTYYDNHISDNIELNRITGNGTVIDFGVWKGGYSKGSDGYFPLNQKPTYTSHTLSYGWGMDVGYTKWTSKTYVLPLVPWIGLLIPKY